LIACLAQAGPAGLEQLAARLDAPQPAVRLAAVDVIGQMHLDHVLNAPFRCDPHLDAQLLDAVVHRASDHSDPEIRMRIELLGELQHQKWLAHRRR
jgi:hypothetical protein